MSDIIEIDNSRALDLLYEVVLGNEEFKYQEVNTKNGESGCYYVHDNQPSCGIGKALALAGVPISVLKKMDGNHSGINIDAAVEIEEAKACFTLTPQALRIFAIFQDYQDHGEPWGTCFQRTIEEYEEDNDN
jgi:hypothetical protein